MLSVVIPFYNVERYLPACLERAACLPPQLCELLLVDDCGQDGSCAIAEAFCATHANARLLHRAHNGGLSAARNTGLRAAHGEYVYFLDSDDLPEPQALVRLTQRAHDASLDVAKARFCVFDDQTGTTTEGPALPESPVMDGASLFAKQAREGLYEPMVWQCVYRRAFLQAHALSMAEGLLFEDELFQTSALLAAARAASSERVILRYRRRPESIMTSFAGSTRWCASYLEVCKRLSRLADSLPASPARAQLRRRVGQIALSTAKNIPAYGLTGDVRQEAEAFVRQNRAALSGYACRSGNALVAAQGALLALSPGVFMRAYAHIRRG